MEVLSGGTISYFFNTAIAEPSEALYGADELSHFLSSLVKAFQIRKSESFDLDKTQFIELYKTKPKPTQAVTIAPLNIDAVASRTRTNNSTLLSAYQTIRPLEVIDSGDESDASRSIDGSNANDNDFDDLVVISDHRGRGRGRGRQSGRQSGRGQRGRGRGREPGRGIDVSAASSTRGHGRGQSQGRSDQGQRDRGRGGGRRGRGIENPVSAGGDVRDNTRDSYTNINAVLSTQVVGSVISLNIPTNQPINKTAQPKSPVKLVSSLTKPPSAEEPKLIPITTVSLFYLPIIFSIDSN
jgi:hypothetical protein